MVEEGLESGPSPGPTFSSTERPSPSRSKVACLSDQRGLMRPPSGPAVCPDSSRSLRKPPSLPRTRAHVAKTAYSQLNICAPPKSDYKAMRIIQHNSRGTCHIQSSSHNVRIHTNLFPRGFTHICILIQWTPTPVRTEAADTNLPYVFIHVFVPIRQIYVFTPHGSGTHIRSMSYTKSSPTKNFIHCSQTQH